MCTKIHIRVHENNSLSSSSKKDSIFSYSIFEMLHLFTYSRRLGWGKIPVLTWFLAYCSNIDCSNIDMNEFTTQFVCYKHFHCV